MGGKDGDVAEDFSNLVALVASREGRPAGEDKCRAVEGRRRLGRGDAGSQERGA